VKDIGLIQIHLQITKQQDQSLEMDITHYV